MATPAERIEVLARIALERGGVGLREVKTARLVERLRRCGVRPIQHGYGQLYHFEQGDLEVRVVVLGTTSTVMVSRIAGGFRRMEAAPAPRHARTPRVVSMDNIGSVVRALREERDDRVKKIESRRGAPRR